MMNTVVPGSSFSCAVLGVSKLSKQVIFSERVSRKRDSVIIPVKTKTEVLMYTHDAAVRPRYAETDQMGVVYHANYLTYFEVGRSEFFRSLGYSYRELEEQGIIFPVIHAEVDYQQPARYDDALRIRTWLTHLKGARLELSYQVLRNDEGSEQILARGKTAHAFVGKDLKPIKLRSANPEMWALLVKCMEDGANG